MIVKLRIDTAENEPLSVCWWYLRWGQQGALKRFSQIQFYAEDRTHSNEPTALFQENEGPEKHSAGRSTGAHPSVALMRTSSAKSPFLHWNSIFSPKTPCLQLNDSKWRYHLVLMYLVYAWNYSTQFPCIIPERFIFDFAYFDHSPFHIISIAQESFTASCATFEVICRGRPPSRSTPRSAVRLLLATCRSRTATFQGNIENNKHLTSYPTTFECRFKIK